MVDAAERCSGTAGTVGVIVRWVIAVDVDGTLFDGTAVAPAAVAALRGAVAAGHVVMVVTGRRYETLREVVPEVLDLAVAVVAEEGAVHVDLRTGVLTLDAPPTEPALVEALVREGVDEIDLGHVAVGAPRDYEMEVRRVHALLCPDREVIINKGSIALVRPGCNKGSGLRTALGRFGEPDAPVLAIGDAENDLAMFAVATEARAVANCDERVRASGVARTSASFGDGVAEAVTQVLAGIQ